MVNVELGGPRPTTHGLRAMSGRDPHEQPRAATALELLFDLTFVIAIGVAGSEFAHLLAEGAYRDGLAGFALATFAVIWAWINFTWFASAFDTDDWLYRVTTTVQMMGVVVLALGLPAMFESLHDGEQMDARAMIVGYVIMRVPLVAQWARAAAQDPSHRRSAATYIVMIVGAQALWVAYAFVEARPYVWLAGALPLVMIELAGPMIAERIDGGTPWHPHHIAERYGLLAIITLGEILLGTVASLSAVIDRAGWTVDVSLIVVGGVGLMVGMWWIYFFLPAGSVLHVRRNKSFLWGYGHLLVYAPIAAVGAGLHVVALAIDGEAHITDTAVMLTVAVPVGIYFVVVALLFHHLVGLGPTVLASTAVKLAVLTAAVVLASAGVDLAVCLLVVAVAPVVSVVAEETGGGIRRARRLDEVLG